MAKGAERVSRSRRPAKKATAETGFDIDVGSPLEAPILGETVDMGVGLRDFPEGSASLDRVRDANDDLREKGNGFYANLVPYIDKHDLQSLAGMIAEDIRAAKDSRKDWIDDLANGLERAGIDPKSDTGSVPFRGASTVVHPVLSMAAVDFQSRASREILPPEGPVKTEVVGKPTEDKSEKANRVARFMNWQLRQQMPEYYPETERMLMMLPFEGTAFKKVWYDPVLKRPRVSYIGNNRMIVPYSASDLLTVPMFAEEMSYHRTEVEELVSSGAWAPHTIGYSSSDEPDKVQERIDRAEGKTRPASDDRNGDIPYYEISIKCAIRFMGTGPSPLASTDDDDIPEDAGDPDDESDDDNRAEQVQAGIALLTDQGAVIPSAAKIAADVPLEPGEDDEGLREWLVVMSADMQEIVSVRRNWEPDDPLRRRVETYVDYRMFPWAGFWGIGYLHMIGKLSAAATGALRALLDSAQISNMPGGVFLRGTRANGQNIEFRPMEWLELEAPYARDVRQVMMPYPHQGPSAVLMQLMDSLVTNAKDFVSVATQQIADANSNMPVGTTLALIEEGSRVYSAIHARLHRVQARELKLIHRINARTLDNETLVQVFGDPDISVEDFDDQIDVIPVSDPNVFSQVQRSAQAQAGLQLVAQAKAEGVKVNERHAYRAFAKAINLPDIDVLFPPDPEPQAADVATEHVINARGGDLTVREDQDHLTHISGHVMLLALPGIVASPGGQKLFIHIQEHVAVMSTAPFLGVWREIVQQMGAGAQGDPPPMPGPLENAASEMALKIIQPLFAQIAPLFEPQDGASLAAKAEFAKADAKVMEVQARLDADRQRLAFDRERVMAEMTAEIQIDSRKLDNALQELRMRFYFEEQKIAAMLQAKLSELQAQMRMKREQIASQERMAIIQQSRPQPVMN